MHHATTNMNCQRTGRPVGTLESICQEWPQRGRAQLTKHVTEDHALPASLLFQPCSQWLRTLHTVPCVWHCFAVADQPVHIQQQCKQLS